MRKNKLVLDSDLLTIALVILGSILIMASLITGKNSLLASITTPANEELMLNYNQTYGDIFPDPIFRKEIFKVVYKSEGELKNEEYLVYSSLPAEEEVLNAITTLKINNKNLVNTKGIEYLVNLKDLDLSYNQLDKLNLSKNVNLENLNISHNKFTELNINELTKLKKIDFSYNSFTNIYLGYNESLKEVILNNNKLSTLNLSKNKALEVVNISHNNFTSLNTSNNIFIRNLNISHNNFKSYEFKHLIDLQELNIDNNDFTLFDLSSNVKLKKIEASNNHLKEIDLTNLEGLTDLNLENNNLETIDLTKNKSLKTLNLSGSQISKINLDKNILLTILNLNDTGLKEINMDSLSELTYLNLGHNFLTEISLIKNPKLKEIYLQENLLENISLKEQKDLETLVVYSNKLTNLDLRENTKLLALRVQNNLLSKLDTSFLQNLKLLALSSNPLPVEEIKLSKNEMLEKLWLRDLKLQNVPLGIPLKNLVLLDLSQNNIEDLGLLNPYIGIKELIYDNQKIKILAQTGDDTLVNLKGFNKEAIVLDGGPKYSVYGNKVKFKEDGFYSIPYKYGTVESYALDLKGINKNIEENPQYNNYSFKTASTHLSDKYLATHLRGLLEKEKNPDVGEYLKDVNKDLTIDLTKLEISREEANSYLKSINFINLKGFTKSSQDIMNASIKTVSELVSKENIESSDLNNALNTLNTTYLSLVPDLSNEALKNLSSIEVNKTYFTFPSYQNLEQAKKSMQEKKDEESVNAYLKALNNLVLREDKVNNLILSIDKKRKTPNITLKSLAQLDVLKKRVIMVKGKESTNYLNTLVKIDLLNNYENTLNNMEVNSQINKMRLVGLARDLENLDSSKEKDPLSLASLTKEVKSGIYNPNLTKEEEKVIVMKVNGYLNRDEEISNPPTGLSVYWFLIFLIIISATLIFYKIKNNKYI